MSSNLSIEAKMKYQEYLDATNIDDRITRLQEYISLVPKHKATERIVALNKTKLAKLKDEKEAALLRKKTINAGKEDPFTIKREPHCIQTVMLSDFFEDFGVGKTRLLKNLTGLSDAKPGIFTAEPLVGIFDWEKVKFQLIEEPALKETLYLSRVLSGVRNADILLLIIDLSRDPIKQMQNIHQILKENNIHVNKIPPNVKVEKTGSGGIQIFFLTKEAKESEHLTDFIIEMVNAFGTKNATVKIYEKINIHDLEIIFNNSSSFKNALIIASKADVKGSKENFEKLKAKFGENYIIAPVAIKNNEEGHEIRQGLENLGENILKKLNLMRIFTRSKKGVAERPLILPMESTIADVALKIHKDLYKTFKFAFVYRESGPQNKIRAGLNFKVIPFDIIEIYSRI